MSCQCRDFPQSYAVMPLAVATRNLFHNFYHLDPYFLLKLIVFLYTTLFSFCNSISYVMTVLLECMTVVLE